MKAGWEVRPLGEVCSKIGSGATPIGGSAAYKREGISLVRSLNVHDLEFRSKDLAKIDEVQARALSNAEVKSGDVLLNITGASVARCSPVPDEFLPARVNQHVAILRPKSEVLVTKFLSYLLVSPGVKGRLLGIGEDGGSTRQALTKAQMLEFPIPLPPLEEQHRIVALLDEAFEGLSRARANAEANLADASQFLSKFAAELVFSQQVEQPPMIRLGSIVTRLTNGYVGPTRDIYLDSGVPYLLARHVRNNELQFDGRTFVSDVFNEKHKKSKLKTGDVLLVQSGHIGHSAVVPDEHHGHNCHAMIVLTPKAEILSGEYLSAVFNTSRFQAVFQGIRTGSTVPHLTCGMVKELTVPVPSVERQHYICGQIAELRIHCDALQASYSSRVEEIDHLRRSILDRALSGELT